MRHLPYLTVSRTADNSNDRGRDGSGHVCQNPRKETPCRNGKGHDCPCSADVPRRHALAHLGRAMRPPPRNAPRTQACVPFDDAGVSLPVPRRALRLDANQRSAREPARLPPGSCALWCSGRKAKKEDSLAEACLLTDRWQDMPSRGRAIPCCSKCVICLENGIFVG